MKTLWIGGTILLGLAYVNTAGKLGGISQKYDRLLNTTSALIERVNLLNNVTITLAERQALIINKTGLKREDVSKFSSVEQAVNAIGQGSGDLPLCIDGQRFGGDPLYYGPCLIQDKPLKKGVESVIVFTDPTCPFCARAHRELKSLWDEHNLSIEYRLVPIHGDLSVNTSVAYYCAKEQELGEEMLEKLFENQEQVYREAQVSESTSSATVIPLMKDYGKQIGTNTTEFEQCIIDDYDKYSKTLELNAGLAWNAYVTRATPTIVFNDNVRIIGAQPRTVFEKTVEALRE